MIIASAKKDDESKQTYRNIRHINDDLYREHNLSVLLDNKHLAKNYKEWLECRLGNSGKSF